MNHPREAVQQLAGSLIRNVSDRGMHRADVLPFWFGESDRPTASFIREAATQSLTAGETFYSQNLGRPWLREVIAKYLTQLHQRPIGEERIAAIDSGVSGLMMAAQLLLSPGDKVVAITPLWPNLCEIPKILGAQVQRVALCVRSGQWALDMDALLAALTPGTRALLINSPNNPTGWTLDTQDMTTLLHHCRQHGIWIVADDVYERLVYDPRLASAPSFLRLYEEGDRIISVNSCSKAWSMTGWRAGWMVLPPALVQDVGKLIEYNTSCIFEPVQRAMCAAVTHGEEEVARLRTRLHHTRALLVGALAALPGMDIPSSSGAMYVFLRIAGFDDSLALAQQLVDTVGLGLAPGVAFGPEGEGWLRWCHAVDSNERLLDGVQRLERFLAQVSR